MRVTGWAIGVRNQCDVLNAWIVSSMESNSFAMATEGISEMVEDSFNTERKVAPLGLQDGGGEGEGV